MPPRSPKFPGCDGGSPTPLPTPTQEGEILYAVTAAAFVPALPLVSDNGYLLTSDSGRLVVKG